MFFTASPPVVARGAFQAFLPARSLHHRSGTGAAARAPRPPTAQPASPRPPSFPPSERRTSDKSRFASAFFGSLLGFAVAGSVASKLCASFAAAAHASAPAGPPREPHSAYELLRTTGDGRCLFRSLVQGHARNGGKRLAPEAETREADALRTRIADAFPGYRERFELFGAIEPGTMDAYVQRLSSPAFWGGELEMLVAADLLECPILVYLSDRAGYYAIQRYGEDFAKATPVRVLYSGGSHYDLLLPRAPAPGPARA